ncbi:MAG: hypothetical protein ACK4OP_06875 [Gemmobacter sp.]
MEAADTRQRLIAATEAVICRAAPWQGEAEIVWRINAALGIRSRVIRNRHRSRVLAAGSVDFDDAEAVIARMVEVIAPMFARIEPPARVQPRPLPRIRTATWTRHAAATRQA